MHSGELPGAYHQQRASGGESSRGKRSSGEVLPIKTLIAQDSSEVEYERKKRSAPSVVARLMGLETLPPGDKSAGKPPSGASKPPKPSKSQQKRSSSTNHHSGSRGESSSGRAESPLEDVDTIRDFPWPRSQPVEPEITEEKSKFDKLPFRSHPQEKQLQEFKKEFMAKLANRRHDTPHAAFDRELEERRRQLREKVCQAKLALLSGGDDSRRLSSAQEKLIESKEFQDAIELLQSNREFFLKFFQEPNSAYNKDPPEPESTSRRSFHLEDYSRDSRRAREFDESSREGSRKSFHFGDLSRESRKSYLLEDNSALKESSRKSFHLDELSGESRRLLLHPESPRRSFHLDDLSRDRETKRNSSQHIEDFAKEIRALEDYSDSQHRHHRHDHHSHSDRSKRREATRHKHSAQGSKPLAEDGLHHSTKSKLEPVDKEQSWADDGRNVSPTNFDARKGCHSPSRIVVLKPGPGEITVLSPAMAPSGSPRSYRIVRDGRGGGPEARESVRDSKVKGARHDPDWDVHPREVETRFVKDRGASDGYRDPRAIAKDIVREAKVNVTREISREREVGRRDPPRVGADVSLVRSSSRGSGKKILSSTPRTEIQEQAPPGGYEAVGSFTLAALSRRHSREEHRSTSPTVPTPSPRIRSQETATTSNSSSLLQKEFKRRFSEKQTAAFYHVDHIEEQLHGSRGTSPVRKASSQVDINRASMSRPTAFPPSSKPHRIRGDPFLESQLHPDDWKGVDVTMYNTLPNSEKILKVESFRSTTSHVSGTGDSEGRESPPRTLSRNRSVPNAAIVGSKAREVRSTVNAVNRVFDGVADRKETSEHFYLKEKRNEARAAYVLSKKRVGGGGGLDSSSTSGRVLDCPWSPIHASPSSVLSNDERTVVQDVHTVSCKEIEPNGPVDPSHSMRTGLENALAAEDSPRSRSDCEQELLAALAQLTPEAKDLSETSAVRKPSGHKLHDVQVGKQGTKSSKNWMLATETLENGDADGASETSVEKCGQPSPVSVLDSPFEAEIPSPVELKELTSDLHDLRLRLRLLKLDESERATALIESLQAKEKLIYQLNHNGVRQTENCQESTEGPSSISALVGKDGRTSLPLRSQALHYRLESLSVDGLPCPEGRKGDLLYVRNLLVASGFTESSTMIIARWNSPLYPLDPCLYERLEEYYNDVNPPKESSCGKQEGKTARGGGASPTNFESTNRKLLFDVVNEIIYKLLGPRLSYRPWVQPGTPLLRPLPTSRQLLSDIWTEICACFSPDGLEEFEALDALMARDVSRGGAWINSREIAEQIGLELERAILDSLVEDAVHCLASLHHVKGGGGGGRFGSIAIVTKPQSTSTYGGPQSWRLH